MPQELDERVLMRKEEKPTLDGLHDLCFLLADNSLSWAPIIQNPSVLDLGSGTGLWVREFAETRNPRKVVGVDLKPPESTEFPSICSFVTANLENEWNISEKFDYIHARFLVGCLFNWPGFFKQCYDTLSPGGWFEIFDVNFPAQSDDGTLKATSDLSKWSQLLIEAGQKCGRELTVAGKFKEIMTEIGFQNVTEVRLKVPVNPWPRDSKGKRLGELSLLIHTAGHERLGMDYLCSETGMTEKEVREKLVGLNRDLADPEIHSWWPFYAVYGQKP